MEYSFLVPPAPEGRPAPLSTQVTPLFGNFNSVCLCACLVRRTLTVLTFLHKIIWRRSHFISNFWLNMNARACLAGLSLSNRHQDHLAVFKIRGGGEDGNRFYRRPVLSLPQHVFHFIQNRKSTRPFAHGKTTSVEFRRTRNIAGNKVGDAGRLEIVLGPA